MKPTLLFATWLLLITSTGAVQSQNALAMEAFSTFADFEDMEHLLMAKDWIRSIISENDESEAENVGLPIPVPKIINGLAHLLIPTSGNKPNVSEKCSNDSNAYIDGLLDLEMWAWRMLDASGKTTDGIWSGNVHAMGHFDECLRAKPDNFKGRFCTVSLEAKKGNFVDTAGTNTTQLSFLLLQLLGIFGAEVYPEWNTELAGTSAVLPSIAFCIPDSCNNNDLAAALVDSLGSNAIHGLQLIPHVPEESCATAADTADLTNGDITMTTILGLIVVCVLAGTVYNGWKQWNEDPDTIHERPAEQENWALRLLLCFSFHNNGAWILRSSEEGELRCLHGLRLFSMLWVFLGHLYLQTFKFPNANTRQFAKDITGWVPQVVTNATIAGDTFFFLSGLLVAYLLLEELERKNGRFNVLMFYVHRYLRLTIFYAIAVGFIATIYKYMGKGPYWALVISESQPCEQTWYQHLLYYNNFGNSTCMPETWYMANDMQMFLISPLLIWPLWRWRRAGFVWLAIVTTGFLVATMTIIGVNDLGPTQMATRRDVDNALFTTLYYTKPWCRIAPYLVGIFIGWTLHITRFKRPKIPPVTVVAGWAMAMACGLTILYGMYIFQLQSRTSHIPLLISVVYGGLHRFTWALILGWVVFACVHGYGGFVNRLLSWEGFAPLSRLSYTTYLIHMHWLTAYNAKLRVSFYYTPVDMGFTYLLHLAGCLGLAFVVSACIEVPFMNIEKLIFGSRRKGGLVRASQDKLPTGVSHEFVAATETLEMEQRGPPADIGSARSHDNRGFEDDSQYEEITGGSVTKFGADL